MNVTEKLYYLDGDASLCSAIVLDCIKDGDFYFIVTDKTVIFPDGGGQPSDFGLLDGQMVKLAYEKDGVVFHRVNKPISIEKHVKISADMKRRLDHSQQHTGEHMLSGLAKQMFNVNNVGFHMGEDYSTIDIDKELTVEQLMELELEANQNVYRDIPIKYDIVNENDIKKFKLRKKASGLKGDIRIVGIEGVDSCTCCGTHCKTTGAVGTIKITAHQKYKGGTRLWFLCGGRAIFDYQNKQAILETLTKQFSVKSEDLLNAVSTRGNALLLAQRDLKIKTTALLAYKAKEVFANALTVNNIQIVIYHEEGMNQSDMRPFAEKLLACSENVIVLLFSTINGALYYQLAETGGVTPNINELIAAVNAAFNARGGGRDGFAQGMGKTGVGVDASIEQITRYLMSVAK
ncbi:MAG: DHHA1 domain-containing protein [Clostridia bacterium]